MVARMASLEWLGSYLMNADVEKVVEVVRTALNDWTATYASEFCDEDAVAAAHKRISKKGTLGYICDAGGAVDKLFKSLRDQEAEIARHVKMLADCFRMSGADPDGNEDWRIAPDALRAVTDLRRDYDEVIDWKARAEALVIRLGEVTTELEKARKDAGRYRFLRAAYADDDQPYIARHGLTDWGKSYEEWLMEDDADTAIDAAMHDSAREGS
jgi:hypothetical protein